jgi:copper chaperone
MTESLSLSIEGMHCGACVRRVTNALQGIPGVTVTSVAVGSAEISFDNHQTDSTKIAATVDHIGFQTHVRP